MKDIYVIVISLVVSLTLGFYLGHTREHYSDFWGWLFGNSKVDTQLSTQEQILTKLQDHDIQLDKELKYVNSSIDNNVRKINTLEDRATAHDLAIQDYGTRIKNSSSAMTYQEDAIASLADRVSKLKSENVDITKMQADQETKISSMSSTLDNNQVALTDLRTTVYNQGQTITAQGQLVTTINNDIEGIKRNVGDNTQNISNLTNMYNTMSSAMNDNYNRLSSRMTVTEGEVTGMIPQITSFKQDAATINTKLDDFFNTTGVKLGFK